MTDIKHEVDESELPSTYELLSTLKSIFTQWLIHGGSRLILVYPAAQTSRKRPQVWMQTKQHEMLESKRPRKSPDAITVCWPMEKLVVLAQNSDDASTLLGDTTEGTLMVLKYERPIQNLRLRRPPINPARVMSVSDFNMLAQACSGLRGESGS